MPTTEPKQWRREFDYVRDVIRWVKRGRHLWGSFGLPIVAVVVFLFFSLPLDPAPEQRIRFAGFLLELLGLFVVGKELVRAQQTFDERKKGTLEVLKGSISDYFHAFPKRGRAFPLEPITGVSAAGLSAVTGAALGTVTGGLTVDERVEALEAYRKEDRQLIDITMDELEKLKTATRESLSKEQQARERLAEQQREFLREFATGGLAAQGMGWLWLVSGMILVTLSQELASNLQRLGFTFGGWTVSASMPFSLVVAWVLFFGFVNTHQRHAARFEGSSQGLQSALMLSTVLGVAVGLGLLVYYFVQVEWYWPLFLFVVGSLIGGIVFALLDVTIGAGVLSMLGFVGWPASAVWVYLIIRDLNV